MAEITRMWIADKMRVIMKHKPIDKIRVTEICKAADIERPTFYYPLCAKYLVAGVMKNSRPVTIMGQQSSGGSCIIMPISLAYDLLAQISGNRCYSNMVNGSVHDIDERVEPDIYIAKPASFADRTVLTQYINSTL